MERKNDMLSDGKKGGRVSHNETDKIRKELIRIIRSNSQHGDGAGCHGELDGAGTPVPHTHMENWRSLASMPRCLMHILVRAEPMSRVPPEKDKRDNNPSENKTLRPGPGLSSAH